MAVPRVNLLGNKDEAERLRGFALSQLEILHDSMKFQGLKQYTRLVRFCDGSFIRAFSSFGLDIINIFVPPVSVPEREIVKVIEEVYIPAEPCEVAVDVLDPEICMGATGWVEICNETCPGAAGVSCDTAVITGTRQVRVICAITDGCTELCGISHQMGLAHCGGGENCDNGLKQIIVWERQCV